MKQSRKSSRYADQRFAQKHGSLKHGQEKFREDDQLSGRELGESVREQLSAAAGTQFFEHRDPIYHISESFTRSFESEGKRLAEGMAGDEQKNIEPSRKTSGKESMDVLYRPREGQTEFWSRFSEMAFSRGTLSSAVLGGEEDTQDGGERVQMMLFSCLKRTIGQSQPKNERQKRLFAGSSVHRHIPGHPAQVIFNRSTVDSAVGITCEALRNARRIADSMCELASGEGVLTKGSGAETLEKLYPFLSVEKEQAALDEYRAKLNAMSRTSSDTSQRAVLSAAIAKNEALIARKRQMKFNFISELFRISKNAENAERALSDDTFCAAAFEKLSADAENDDSSDTDIPPEDISGKDDDKRDD